MYTAQKLFSLLAFFFVFLFLVFIQTTIASDESDVGFDYVIEEGELFVDIVDEFSGVSIDNPVVNFGEGQFSNDPIVAYGTLGTSSESVRLFNYTSHPSWTLNLAGENPANEWISDFDNYPFNSPDDASLGRLSVNPESALISSDVDCSIDGISTGSLATYQSGLVDSIDLMFASSSASPFCRFDLQEVDLEQIVPGSQPVGTYTLGMVLTASYSPGDDPESSGPLGLDTEVTDDGILLGWSAPDEEDDYEFKVERSSSPWRTLVERTSDTSYLDDDIEEGVSYSYRITSYNSSGVAGVSDASIPMVTWRVSYVSSSGGSVTPVMRLVENGGFVSGVQTFPDEGFHLVDFEVIQGEGNGFLHEPTGAVVNVTGGMRVRANFSINEYNLLYSAGPDGSVSVDSSSQSVTYGSDGSAVEAIADEGYTFTGWSDGRSDNPRTDTNVTADIDVTALFELNSYDVIVSASPPAGGSVLGGGSYFHGDDVTVEASNSVGYTFDYWSEGDSVVSSSPVYTFNLLSSRDLVANFVLSDYSLVFEDWDGGIIESTGYSFGSDLSSHSYPSDPVREGYTFTGWSDVIPPTMPASNVIIVAEYSINSYDLIFRDWDNTQLQFTNYDFGADLSSDILPSDPSRVGYTFTGWSDSLPSTMPAENLTLVAQYDINNYDVYLSSSPAIGGNTTGGGSYAYGSSVEVTATANTGYTFTDWSEGSNEITGVATYTFNMPANNRDLVANFTLNAYTVTFKDWDGDTLKTEGVDHGASATAPANPSRTGYTFTGWDVDFTNVTDNLEVTAQYSINQYTITFNSAGGSAVSSITQDYETSVTAPANPTRTGYTFSSWEPVVPSTMPAENLTLVAQWTINNYDVSLSSSPEIGGGTTGAGSYNFNSSVTVTANANTGYTFSHWSEGGNTISGATYTFIMPANNRDLVAHFTLNQYTVSYTASTGGSVNPTSEQINWDTGNTGTTPSANTGYTFTDYTLTNGSCHGTFTPSTGICSSIRENITIRANFTLNSYTVTYTRNPVAGGTLNTYSRTVTHGSSAAAPGYTTSTGYTFNNFTVTSGSCGGTFTASTGACSSVTGNMTIQANWTINSYTVSYTSTSGGSVSTSSRTVTHGGTSAAPGYTEDAGYIFVNFTRTSGSGGTLNQNTGEVTNVTENQTIQANFEEDGPSACSGGSGVVNGVLTDSRDNKTYSTVEIGTQCWMAENLNVGTRINGANNQGTNCASIQKYCYDNSEGNCTTYGGLYQWNQAMCGSSTAGAQGICPTGWHIPTDGELTTLTNYVGTNPGTKLKATSPGWNGTDNFGFTALPGGSRYSSGSFSYLGSVANFWSSTASSATNAWFRHLISTDVGVNRYSGGPANGFGVRCLRD